MSKSYQLNQIQLVSAINAELSRQIPNLPFEPRFYNSVIKAATSICDELSKPIVKATKGMGLQAWLDSDDVGMSSKFMAGVLSGRITAESAQPHYPRDGADFGRCVRLLEAVPEFVGLLPCMKQQGPNWAALVDIWDMLTELYNTDRGEDLYARMMIAYGDL